jgi:hypothetical protein
MTRTCTICDVEFSHRNAKTCSRKCQGTLAAISAGRQLAVERECTECQTVFKRGCHETRTCSRRCMGIARKRDTRAKRMEKICLECSTPFKIRQASKTDQQFCNRACFSAWNTGENNPSWQGGLTGQDVAERNRFGKNMLTLVFERDDYTCQSCFKRGDYLHVDHILPWATHPYRRFDLDNCVTLCIPCHYEKTWGKPMPENSTWGKTWMKRPLDQLSSA